MRLAAARQRQRREEPDPGAGALDPLEPARLDDADFPKVRVFGHDPAEIVPHAGDHARDYGLGKLGKRAAVVAPSMSGAAERRRASAPPRAEAQSRGNNLNAPNESAAPQA